VAQTAQRRSAAIERVNHLLAAEIARRQHAQQELQRMATELTRSNRELEDFAGIASHDLRAPLQKVKSFAELLEEDFKPCLDQNGRDVLQRLKKSVSRMQRLVDDLLELARVRAKGRPFTRVDLAQVARDVLSDLEPMLQASGGTIELGELPVIDADPTQMHQLLQNLAGNGLKFQRPGDTPLVRIEATLIENPAGGAPLCRLRVSDNGIGFDDKHALRIFRPFERLHGQSEYEGSGMGLAVCARIAERHGGTIVAHGVPGQGASFAVTLPMRHAASLPGRTVMETAEMERQTELRTGHQTEAQTAGAHAK
jgi:light-regulated signal transduction histidine kinase (bacteriophytochrome)